MSHTTADPQVQPTPSALALLLGAIKPCSAWAPAGSSAHGVLPYLGSFDLPLSEHHKPDSAAEVLPLALGSGCAVGPQGSLGPTQPFGYKASGFAWVRVTGFLGGQGLFTVKT